ncbi:MAG: zinc metallopeptidase [Chitinophagales bacterium]|nr:zinc metallopeptidase [Chitinophagales bacterium]MCZ2392492.1 zinc metallopeptidase [Chitinophagales bacterium]
MYYIIIIVFMGLSMIVSARLKSKFKKYSQSPIGMTGAQVAQKMLRDNGINDVDVISTPGALTDHYNPANKTVNLSDWVYSQNTVAAAAVAAHECGHAVQHAHAYTWLGFRSKMVPALNISSKIMPWLIMGGIFLFYSSGNSLILIIGIAMFALTTIFSFVTLPVEFDASNRALKWLDTARILNREDHDKAKDALKWAAMTYVVAALASLAQLLYYLSILNNRRD